MVYVKNDKFPDYQTYQKFCNDVKLLLSLLPYGLTEGQSVIFANHMASI